MKMELSSERREMLLFLSSNMTAVTSSANQQFISRVLSTLSVRKIPNVDVVAGTSYQI